MLRLMSLLFVFIVARSYHLSSFSCFITLFMQHNVSVAVFGAAAFMVDCCILFVGWCAQVKQQITAAGGVRGAQICSVNVTRLQVG